MAYSTGTAASLTALFDAISSFAVANAGFSEVVNRTETISSAPGTVRCLSKGSSYFWFFSPTGGRYFRGQIASGSSGATWGAIPGKSGLDVYSEPWVSPFTTYHLFTDGTVIHVAAQMSSGAFQHFSFGDVTKYGAWTGGQFIGVTHCQYVSVYGTTDFNPDVSEIYYSFCGLGASGDTTAYNNNAIHTGLLACPLNGKPFASSSRSILDATYNKLQSTGVMPTDSAWGYRGQAFTGPNYFNSRTPGLLVELFVYDTALDLHRPVGYLPGRRLVHMQNYVGGETINTDWMVFPMGTKAPGVVGSTIHTGQYGWAIKK